MGQRHRLCPGHRKGRALCHLLVQPPQPRHGGRAARLLFRHGREPRHRRQRRGHYLARGRRVFRQVGSPRHQHPPHPCHSRKQLRLGGCSRNRPGLCHRDELQGHSQDPRGPRHRRIGRQGHCVRRTQQRNRRHPAAIRTPHPGERCLQRSQHCRHPPFRRSTPYRWVRCLQGKDATRSDPERERQEEGKGSRRPFHRSSQPPLRNRSEHGGTTKELRNRFYVLKKNIRNKSKRNTSKRNASKRNTYHEQHASAKTQKKKSNIETLAISCWIAVGDSL